MTRIHLIQLVYVAPVCIPLVYMAGSSVYQIFRLVFGTLFPAYYSYKAVRTKNVKEYVKWMMYWIVFAFFTCLETLTDLFLAFWFPFYYELKILLVLWLLSPATRGSSVLYRKFVHPWLTQKEEDIDECIARAKEQGYSTVLQLGSKGVNYATTVIMQTAIKGGGGIVNHLKRSYSVGELAASEDDHDGGADFNRNVKALPAHDGPDYHHHHSGGTVIGRSSSHSNVSSSRRGASSSRAAKTLSVDASDLYHSSQDLTGANEGGDPMTTSMPAPTATRRRSQRTHHDSGPSKTSVPGTTSYKKSKTGEISAYATLPRGISSTGTKRPIAKKRQI